MSSEVVPPSSDQPHEEVPTSSAPAEVANPPADAPSSSAPSSSAPASVPAAAAPPAAHDPAQPRPSVTSSEEKGTPDRRGTEVRRISEIRDDFITERDRKALEELRPKIRAEFGAEHEADQNDFKLMRFIRARKYDIEAAYQQYSKTVHWRKKNHVDQWATFDVQNIRCLVPETFHGFDKHGWPSYIVKAGQVDPNRVRRMSVQDFIQVHIWGNEYSFQRAAEKGRELGKPVDRFSNIIDLEGLGTKHRKILHYVKAVAKIDERFYPECLGHTYIVNAPWIFGIIWSLVKSWLDPVTVSKISVLGPDYKKELLKYYDAKDLPVEYGGTCQCAGGCFKIPTDKEIDEAMNRHEAKMKLTEHKIKAGESFSQVISTGKFGANIRLYFRSKDYDVKLSATFTPDPAQQVPLQLNHPAPQSAVAAPGPAAPGGAAPAPAPTPLPKGAIPAVATAVGAQPVPIFAAAKVDSHKQPEMHVFDVYGPGKLQIVWDNSYSIWKDKVIFYHVHSEDHDEAPHEIDAEEYFPLNLV